MGLNMWIIYVPPTIKGRRENLSEVLEYTPLRLDSYTFQFYDDVDGKALKCNSWKIILLGHFKELKFFIKLLDTKKELTYFFYKFTR